MLYYSDISYYYLELIHLLTSNYIWIDIKNKEIIDRKVKELVKILKEIIKEEK